MRLTYGSVVADCYPEGLIYGQLYVSQVQPKTVQSRSEVSCPDRQLDCDDAPPGTRIRVPVSSIQPHSGHCLSPSMPAICNTKRLQARSPHIGVPRPQRHKTINLVRKRRGPPGLEPGVVGQGCLLSALSLAPGRNDPRISRSARHHGRDYYFA
jgi:hypothetical protein